MSEDLKSIDTQRVEAESAGNTEGALSHAIRQADGALEQNHEGYLKRALDSMPEYLRDHGGIPRADFEKLQALLNRVPDKIAHLRAEVKGALRSTKPVE